MKRTFVLASLIAVFAQSAAADLVVPESELAELRGGFITHSGITISFGIERATLINGMLQTTQRVDLGGVDLKTLGWTPAGATSSARLDPVVIQNNLDGQKIQNLTVINATLTGMALFREHARASLLNDQIMRFAR